MYTMAPDVECSVKSAPKSKVFLNLSSIFQCFNFFFLSAMHFRFECNETDSFFKFIQQKKLFSFHRSITAADNGRYRIDIAVKVDWISFGIH